MIDSTLVSAEDVRRMVPGCDRTLARRIKRGEFPPPIWIGGRRYWSKTVLERWVAQKTAVTA